MAFTWDIFLLAVSFGFMYGFLLQKADFCFVASIRDWISVRDTRILNGVLVLIVTSLVGWYIVLSTGAADISQIWTVPIGGANLLGGILFGIGMTLAGGCGSGTLYRCGMGYVQFWIVLLFAIIGNLIFAAIYDPWARDYVVQPLTINEQGFTLYNWSIPTFVMPAVLILIIVGGALYRYGWSGIKEAVREAVTDWQGNPLRQRHWDIRVVAVLLASIATIQFAVMSNVSITGPETRIGAVAIALLFGDDVIFNNTYLNALFSDFPKIGLGPEESLIFALILGSFTAAFLSGSFRWRLPRLSRLPNAIIGGLLMGIASRMAPGCNIANLITGVGGLSVSSFIVIIGMIIGIFIVVAFIFKMPLLLFQRQVEE